MTTKYINYGKRTLNAKILLYFIETETVNFHTQLHIPLFCITIMRYPLKFAQQIYRKYFVLYANRWRWYVVNFRAV